MSDKTPAPRATTQRLVVGGIPRAELLPPELKQEQKARATRRVYGFVVVLVIAAVGAAYVFSALGAEVAQQQLRDASTRTDDLLAEQTKYLEVRQLAAQVTASEDARTIGMASEIDWSEFLALADAKAAAIGASFVQVILTASTPLTPMTQPTVPLEGERVATIEIQGISPTLPVAADWIDMFEDFPGFVDGKITDLGVNAVGYEFSFVLHLNSEAYSNRFAVDDGADADDAATDETDGEVTP